MWFVCGKIFNFLGNFGFVPEDNLQASSSGLEVKERDGRRQPLSYIAYFRRLEHQKRRPQFKRKKA